MRTMGSLLSQAHNGQVLHDANGNPVPCGNIGPTAGEDWLGDDSLLLGAGLRLGALLGA